MAQRLRNGTKTVLHGNTTQYKTGQTDEWDVIFDLGEVWMTPQWLTFTSMFD